MRVRAAVPGDGLAIETVRVLGWQAAYRGLVPDEVLDAMSPAAGVGRWEAYLARESAGQTFVSAGPAGVTGFIGVGPTRDEELAGSGLGEIFGLYVHPAAWGSGAGQALMSAGLAALPGVPVVLWVLTGNARARAFYARNGFRPDGAAKGYAVGGIEVPELRLRLEA